MPAGGAEAREQEEGNGGRCRRILGIPPARLMRLEGFRWWAGYRFRGFYEASPMPF
jgi:hypothetical protein